jgi:alcohol dehydrogenase class IV
MANAFRHVDRDQTIVLGERALEAAGDLVGSGYTLLTTTRAAAATPAVADRAAVIVEVPPGAVDAIAAELRPAVADGTVVALGGGRVIDTAKAIAAAEGLLGP